jgi:hypothetical protein
MKGNNNMLSSFREEAIELLMDMCPNASYDTANNFITTIINAVEEEMNTDEPTYSMLDTFNNYKKFIYKR